MDRATFALPRAISDKPTALMQPFVHLETWVSRRVGNIDHERRVFQIAGAFFDLTRDLHGLSRADRWTLSAAALAHDVGRSVNPAEHPEIGSEMILSDPALHIASHVRRSLAYLTLYHRGAVPDLGDADILRGSDDCAGLLKVLALLRAADTLDSRSIDPPRLLLARRDRRIQIRCIVRDRPQRAEKAFCRPKKYRLLEETLGCTLEVQVQLGDARALSQITSKI